MLNQETAASTPIEKPATETPATTLVLTDAAAAKFRDLTKGRQIPPLVYASTSSQADAAATATA